jgi:hypothetical protein
MTTTSDTLTKLFTGVDPGQFSIGFLSGEPNPADTFSPGVNMAGVDHQQAVKNASAIEMAGRKPGSCLT